MPGPLLLQAEQLQVLQPELMGYDDSSPPHVAATMDTAHFPLSLIGRVWIEPQRWV